MSQLRQVRQVRANRQMYGRAEPLRRPQRQRKLPTVGPRGRRFMLLVVVLLAAGWGLSRLFAVSTVVVNAPSRASDIQAETLKLVQTSWGQGNLLTCNGSKLVSDLQRVDPTLRQVNVHRRWLHTLVVTAVLKDPSLGWATGGQQNLLDRDGTVIGAYPLGSKLPVVTDDSNLPTQVGQRVASAQFVSFVSALAPALAATGITPTGYSIRDTTFDLTVSTGRGYQLIFDTSRPATDEVADLKAVLALLASQKHTPSSYIDLRVAGKAYYK